MSQVLTVPTHFNDIGELSEGFLDRVEQDTLILYGPVAYDEGSEIEFVVLLADGTPALEGFGRVRASVDGGEDRIPETRYDVVVDALELDGRSEVVFERLVIARQAVSDRPPDEQATSIEEADSVAAEALSLAPDEATSIPPEEDAPDTVPPEAEASGERGDEEYDDDDEPDTVIAAVDAQAMMAEDLEDTTGADAVVEEVELGEVEEVVAAASVHPEAETISGEEVGYDVETAAMESSPPDAAFELDESETERAFDPETSEDRPLPQDSMYAFEHGIAAEPRVGMPVPVPSMAAPPEAPPAPPTLRLAEPPEGLTRPSLAQSEPSLLTVDDEVSDVHTTGLFNYEEGLPIPSRPPLPDPNRVKKVAPVEAANDYDVQDSEPAELLAEDYEEVRLSDFAEAAEEG